MKVHDVAICGPSLAGLTLARALAASLPGIDIAIFGAVFGGWPADPAKPESNARAYAIAAASRRALQALDAWGAIAPDAEPVTGIDISDTPLDAAVRPFLLQYDTSLAPGEPAAHIVADEVLRTALRQSVTASNGITHYPEAPRELAHEPAYRRLTLRDGGEARARLVVLADGPSRPLAEKAGIGIVGWTYEQRGIVARIAHGEPHGGRAVQHFLEGGPFALLPMTGKRSCVTWTEPEASARAIMAGDDATFLGELRRRIGNRLGALEIISARSSWPLQLSLARQLAAPRLALIADAARLVHPLAGQGLNLGLRDVATLTEVIAEAMRLGLDPGNGTALERYERWRRFDGASAALAFDALNRLFSREESVLRSVRGAALGVLNRLDGLKGLLVEEAAGTTGMTPRLLRGELS